jgi:hypothetical protein
MSFIIKNINRLFLITRQKIHCDACWWKLMLCWASHTQQD